jgi:glycosyltransferase involved in cell wall biosynthesis
MHPISAPPESSPLRPEVSVILPTYNRAGTLGRAIASVLAQTFKDFELIIIDDGSTDRTSPVVESFPDARIQAIRWPDNRGAACARNHGIQLARGRLIAFQDSDDAWRPEKLARQVAVLEGADTNTGVAYTNFTRVRAGGTRPGISRARILVSKTRLPRTRLAGDVSYALARGNFITTQAALVRKSCLEAVGGFDEGLRRLVDWDLWLRLAPRTSFAFIEQPLVARYITPGSISSQPNALLLAFERIIARQEPGSTIYKALLAQSHFARAEVHMQRGELAQGRERLSQALRTSPDNGVYWLTWIAALLGPGIYLRWVHTAGLSYFEGENR